MQILSKDISIVLQGPIIGKPNEPVEKQSTQSCIDNLRQFLPDAEIIVSTWEGSDVSHLSGYDILIFSEDPGAITYNDYELKNVYNNNNRQIVSTYNGLKAATRKFALKYRNDLRLKSLNFLNYFKLYDNYNSLKIFDARIVTSNVYVRDWAKIPFLNHISDIFQFGYREDLIFLWDIAIQPEPETTRAFSEKKIFWGDLNKGLFKWMYTPEQYIWVTALKKRHIDVSLKYANHIAYGKIKKSIIALVDNFTIVDNDNLGIEMPEKLLQYDIDKILSHRKWLLLYEELCVKKSSKILYNEIYYTFRNSVKRIYNNRRWIVSHYKNRIKNIYK